MIFLLWPSHIIHMDLIFYELPNIYTKRNKMRNFDNWIKKKSTCQNSIKEKKCTSNVYVCDISLVNQCVLVLLGKNCTCIWCVTIDKKENLISSPSWMCALQNSGNSTQWFYKQTKKCPLILSEQEMEEITSQV